MDLNLTPPDWASFATSMVPAISETQDPSPEIQSTSDTELNLTPPWEFFRAAEDIQGEAESQEPPTQAMETANLTPPHEFFSSFTMVPLAPCEEGTRARIEDNANLTPPDDFLKGHPKCRFPAFDANFDLSEEKDTKDEKPTTPLETFCGTSWEPESEGIADEKTASVDQPLLSTVTKIDAFKPRPPNILISPGSDPAEPLDKRDREANKNRNARGETSTQITTERSHGTTEVPTKFVIPKVPRALDTSTDRYEKPKAGDKILPRPIVVYGANNTMYEVEAGKGINLYPGQVTRVFSSNTSFCNTSTLGHEKLSCDMSTKPATSEVPKSFQDSLDKFLKDIRQKEASSRATTSTFSCDSGSGVWDRLGPSQVGAVSTPTNPWANPPTPKTNLNATPMSSAQVPLGYQNVSLGASSKKRKKILSLPVDHSSLAQESMTRAESLRVAMVRSSLTVESPNLF